MHSSRLAVWCVVLFGSLVSVVLMQRNVKLEPSVEFKAAADGILEFTANLIKTLHHSTRANENLICSPVSIYGALSIAYLGAAGKTHEELRRVLKSSDNSPEGESFHKNVGDILESIQRKEDHVVAEVQIANGLFITPALDLKKTYSDQSKSFYRTDIQKVKFTDRENSFRLINDWVAEKTKGRITQLFSEPLDADTISLLCSSLFFQGRWSEHFYEVRTKNESFYTGIENIEVPLMHNEDTLQYWKNTTLGGQAIVLPYDGRDFAMGIVLPDEKQSLYNLTGNLTGEHIKQIFQGDNYVSVDYKIPRMKFSSSISLKDSLTSMGMGGVFNVANFSKMVEAVPLKISDVKHAAEIEVDEDGTRASAITTVQLIPLSGKVVIDPIKFYVNRPFLILIWHRSSSTVLFAGAVHKPTA